MSTKPIRCAKNALYILDQRRLPLRVEVLKVCSTKRLIQAIQELSVRGAPLIGVAGAYGCYLAALEVKASELSTFLKQWLKKVEQIASSRPTAVNLCWATDRMSRIVLRSALSPEGARKLIWEEAHQIHEEERASCFKMGNVGVRLMRCKEIQVLTVCNAGTLATGGLGTALAPIFCAKKQKKKLHVWVTETRPLLQGARLTAWELKQAGIRHTLICDNMAASVMQSGKVDMILVGADRISLNGDTANKIGTYSLAVLAKHHKIPFYVVAPFSTVDPMAKDGSDIPIEMREPAEVLGFQKTRWASSSTQVLNPAFDITPHNLITGFITDHGLIKSPFKKKLNQ